MKVIKLCDYFLETSLPILEAQEYIQTKIIDMALENGEDFAFSVDDFIDNIIELNSRFEIIEDADEWDLEFTPEAIDEIIENISEDEEYPYDEIEDDDLDDSSDDEEDNED